MSEEVCPICLSNMDAHEDIKIECGHRFHTKCIMKWFRSSRGQCPCCLDNPFQNGINNNINIIGSWNQLYINERCSSLRKNTRKKDCPEKLKKKFDNLRTREEELKNMRKEKSKIIKSNEYRDIIKKKRELDSKIYNKEKFILKTKARIVSDYPTILVT
jgi:adenylate kinase family enzyme